MEINMGLFEHFKKKKEEAVAVEDMAEIYAPIKGMYIELKDIPDQVFSAGILGNGCGIEPEVSNVVSPVNGIISTIAETKHAIGITAENGMEILIHVGMDTVKMQGNGFDVKVKEGQKVSCGTCLMQFDMDIIREAGYPVTTAFVITNSDDYASKFYTGKIYEQGEIIGRSTKL